MPKVFALHDDREVGTAELGRATELRVQAELIERGHVVSVPAIDTGFDLLVEGKRVQVKASNLRPLRTSGNYVFSSKRGWQADVYVLRGVQDDLWWIIPHAHMVSAASSVSLALSPAPQGNGTGRPNRTKSLDVFLGAWWVFDV